MLEHRHLRYFTAVAEELNFSRAAERLHMAQPPLSAAIRKLECAVGTELFTRTSREVRLTEAGTTFLVGARRVLAELEHTVQTTRRAAAGELGGLRLAFSPAARYEALPTLGRALRATHPDIELLTGEMWPVDIVPALRSGAVNAALCTCPEPSPGMVCETVRNEPIVALLPTVHPLAERDELGLRELRDETFMLVAPEVSPRLHRTLVAACRRAGFEPRLRSGGLHSAWELEILADLQMVSLAPASVRLELPAGLAPVRVGDALEPIETVVLARADDSSPVVAALRAVAQEVRAASERRTPREPGSRLTLVAPVPG